jgi:hypothetical protein
VGLSKIDFRNANLSNAYFHGGRLDDCDFTGANVDGASFEKIRLTRCDFTGIEGREELQQTDVDERDCTGLDEDDDALEDDEDDEDEGIVYLRDELPKGFRRLSLDDLIAQAAKIVKVEHGKGATDAELAELETKLGTLFPADYKAFLKRFGFLKMSGSASHTFGTLEVFGVTTLESTHKKFHDAFGESGLKADWLESKCAETTTEPGTIPQRKIKLRNALKLADSHMKKFIGDGHDALRIAQQFMVPIMAIPSALHQAAECIGPDAQIYTVAIKARAVEPPSGTFTSRLLQNLEGVVVSAD